MQTITTHDVSVNGVLFIMELTLDEDGESYMTLTEACNHPQSEDCAEPFGHKTYDFKETE